MKEAIEDVKQALDALQQRGVIEDWEHKWGEVRVLKSGPHGGARKMSWEEAESFVSGHQVS